MTTPSEAWDAMEPRSRDAWIADNVFDMYVYEIGGAFLQWRRDVDTSRRDGDLVPPYSEHAACDYRVLVHVRENWTVVEQNGFSSALNDIWSDRRVVAHRGLSRNAVLFYERGDYSKAAYLVLRDPQTMLVNKLADNPEIMDEIRDRIENDDIVDWDDK